MLVPSTKQEDQRLFVKGRGGVEISALLVGTVTALLYRRPEVTNIISASERYLRLEYKGMIHSPYPTGNGISYSYTLNVDEL